MVRIRHERGGNGIGPHWWPEDDPVCEVPEELARDLLAHPEWGYSLEPDPEPEGGDDEQPNDGDPGAADAGEHEKPPAKPAARRSRAKPATA